MLMLFTPDAINLIEIVEEVNKIPGAGNLHHVHVWHLNEEELHLEAHLDFAHDITISEFDELLHKIEEVVFEKFNINHVTIQPEYKKEDPKEIIVQD
jgi:cobalt-zinc-cadmium efflux system protein